MAASDRNLQLATSAVAACAGAYVLGRALEVLWVRAAIALRPANLAAFKGQYAIVTGGSEGIGLAIAQQLAKQGINLVLVARSPSKLAAAAASLPSTIQCITLPLDLTQPGAVQQLMDSTKDLPLSIIIANAGGGVSSRHPFWEQTPAEIDHVRDLNGTQAYQLLHKAVPRLLQQGKGAIVVVSSQAPIVPGYLAPYAAEKSKLETLVAGLQQELSGTGVTIQAFRFGMVLTPGLLKAHHSGAPAPKPSIIAPAPDTVARSTVAAIGRTGPLFTPYWGHALSEGIITSIWPNCLQRWVTGRVSKGGAQDAEKSAAAAAAAAAAADHKAAA